MNHVSLQALTWGTVGAAIVSAMLLAAAGDEHAAALRFEPPSAGPRQAPRLLPGARAPSPSLREARPAGSAPSDPAERR
ncbi:hypothetical protein [uncultured Methylibium sp.]|uniref:hypothetical protein n=1 Tax=uncultured Methylibium sp. TaxID=381093 RepID=UPI0025E5C1A4|nr:hypothetical protein [uncultured Methylibium sp.]